MVLHENPTLDDDYLDNHPAIHRIAEDHDFTYDEALAYVVAIGLAYAHRPPEKAPEPGE